MASPAHLSSPSLEDRQIKLRRTATTRNRLLRTLRHVELCEEVIMLAISKHAVVCSVHTHRHYENRTTELNIGPLYRRMRV